MGAELESSNVRVTGCAASKQEWIGPPGIGMKVLAVDEARNSVDYLLKIGPGSNSGKHRHLCETYGYILEGTVINYTTGCEFNEGDFCYQPFGDVHVEGGGPEGAIIHVSLRGKNDTLVEFYDDDDQVCSKYKIADFVQMLST